MCAMHKSKSFKHRVYVLLLDLLFLDILTVTQLCTRNFIANSSNMRHLIECQTATGIKCVAYTVLYSVDVYLVAANQHTYT